MDFDFSIASRPVSTVAVKLKVIYLLNANQTNDVKRKPAGTQFV
jgi:hypothetical protein